MWGESNKRIGLACLFRLLKFIKGNGEFTINIALIENRYPILGYVYSPIKKVLYVGGLNKSSFKIFESNIDELSVSLPNDPIRIVASRSHLNEETQKFISQFQSLLNIENRNIRYCLVLINVCDLIFIFMYWRDFRIIKTYIM